jgi:murein DD-endopeptidase MepM/ murein hydrolase activator NlpD
MVAFREGMRNRARSRSFLRLVALVCLLAGLALLPVSARAQISSPNGAVSYYEHVFPVQGLHRERGPVGEFGAPRSGGRIHEGFDVLAACGTELVSVVTGRVLRTGYDPVLYGNYLLIHGQGEDRSYFFAHMRRPPLVHRGETVFAGQRVGEVGKTGNARTVGCQLHIEIHVHGIPINPKPEMLRWDRYS